MGIRQRKPTSPGRRFQTVSDFSELTTDRPEKSLLAKKSSSGGRNSYGRKTARHRGGGHKQRYRIIDFRRNKDGVPAKVATIEYDPNRNARICLLHYLDGEKRYILAPKDVKVGDRLRERPRGRDPGRQRACRCATSRSAPPCTTSSSAPAPAASWPARPAPRCSSSARRATSPSCACPPRRCGGSPSSAGPRSARSATPRPTWSRWARPAATAGRASAPRPAGVAMNPVDHPLGGGEGKTSGGRHPVSPWGKPETRTRRTKKPSQA